MNPSIQAAIPAVVVFTMAVVGLELTLADFRRVAQYPKTVLVGVAGQWILLPITAVQILILDLPDRVSVGLLLLAACPAGGITNFFTYLARANTALSVTLTAVATVLAIFTMPALLAAGFTLFPEAAGEIEIPVFRIIAQLFLLMLVPLGVGMALRFWREDFVRRVEPRLRVLSLAAILGLLVWILIDQRERFADELGPVLQVCALFTLSAMLAGFAIGWLAGLEARDRLTLVSEFSSRNLGIAILIAVSVLGLVEFLFFASILFVASTVLMLLAAARFRASRSDDEAGEI